MSLCDGDVLTVALDDRVSLTELDALALPVPEPVVVSLGDDDELTDDVASEQVAEIEEAPGEVAAELALEAAEEISSHDEPASED